MLVERASLTENVQIFFKMNEDANDWIPLGVVTAPQVASFFLGKDDDAPTGSVDSNDYSGITFDKIKFRFDLARGSDTVARPVIRWFTFVARQYLRPNRTWRLVLDLTKNEDYSEDELAAKLDALALTKKAVEFVHRNNLYKVEVVALEVDESTGGTDLTSQARVDLIESNEMI
jgi:hypothetical protein